ncbi:RNA-binding protein [Thioclava sp. 'Guangxiensis']|uniref:RNA-binding protein n=1 Tax=Thioclava sp. 'Guangxiensis' TaxID=3149044 RepID=UPI003877CFAE
MSRGGRDKTNDESERRCIVTQDVQPKVGLVRFVLGPDGLIYPDVAEKLPGRGIWVTSDREIIEKAVAKGLFSRGAKTKAEAPDNLADLVDQALAQRVVELISLVRKSGKAVCGFEKVKGWLAEGRAKVLFQATDGSERGKGKLWTPEGSRWFGCLTSAELGLAFGRDRAIHGALGSGGLTPRVITEAARLAGMRKQDGGKAAASKDTKTA